MNIGASRFKPPWELSPSMEFKVGAKESENDAYLHSMEFPSQPKSMVVDFKVTMPSMSEPSK